VGADRALTGPSWTHYLIGLAGLAMVRSWDAGDEQACERRLAELAELTSALGGSRQEVAIVEVGVREGYDAWAASYESEPNGLMTLSDDTTAALVADLPAGSAVDLGCGAGRGLRRLAATGHRVLGVDFSPVMLAKARRQSAGALVAGDLAVLPLRSHSVDLVTCTLALAHQPDLGAIAELARVLRPGGHAVLIDVHPMFVLLGGHALAHSDGRMTLVRNHVHPVSAYLAAFAAAGLEVEACVEPLLGPSEAGALEISEQLANAVEVAFADVPVLLGWRLRSAC